MRLKAIWDVALAAAVAVFVLAVLDVFLSDTQKQWLGDRTVRLWHWLAEVKRHSLLEWLQSYRRLIVWTGVILVSIYMAWAFEKALGPITQVALITLGIFGIGVLFGLKIIRSILRAPSLFRAVIRATIIVAVTLAPVIIFYGSVYAFQDTFLGLAKEFAASVAAHTPTLGLALFALSFLWGLILCVHLTVIAIIFWLVVALPLAVTYLVSILLFCSEFVVRRIAEYPKGPIFAGSLLLGAISGIFRVIFAGH
jgi:hypothetical protein